METRQTGRGHCLSRFRQLKETPDFSAEVKQIIPENTHVSSVIAKTYGFVLPERYQCLDEQSRIISWFPVIVFHSCLLDLYFGD